MANITQIQVGSTTYDVGGSSNYAEVTLSTTWSGTAPNLYQTVSVTGMTASLHPVCDVVIPGGSATQETIDAANEAWSKIYSADSQAGSIKFYATEATTTAITVGISF